LLAAAFSTIFVLLTCTDISRPAAGEREVCINNTNESKLWDNISIVKI